MIEVEGTKLSILRITLFSTDHVWESVEGAGENYEMLYVVEGNLFIEEEILYSMTEGNMVILKPRKTNRKYRCTPNSVFYWIRFCVEDVEKLTGGKYFFKEVQNTYLFKEMLHYFRVYKEKPELAELLLAQLLIYNKLVAKGTGVKERKLVAEVYEMIRLNASPKLKAYDVAPLFGYNTEHLTRLVKKEYGRGIKELINDFTVKKCKNELANTNKSIKEISAEEKFEDTESFVKFFKYHVNMTPSQYRERHTATSLIPLPEGKNRKK